MRFYEGNNKIVALLKEYIEKIIGINPDSLDITMINIKHIAKEGKSAGRLAIDSASPRHPVILYGKVDKDRMVDGDFQSAISKNSIYYWNFCDGDTLRNFIACHYPIKSSPEPLAVRLEKQHTWIAKMRKVETVN